MELTPQALHDVEFREARRGGYNTRDVDDFLERVAIGVGQLQDRLREAYHRAEAAEARLVDMQRQMDDMQRRAPEGPSDADETLRRTLVLAQRTADATIKEAKDEADRLLTDARDEAARVRSSAESDARRDAKVEIEQLASSREDLLQDIESLERHLDEQRSSLRTGIDKLRQMLDEPALRTKPAPSVSELPSFVNEPPTPPASPTPEPPAYEPPAYDTPSYVEPSYADPPAYEPPSFTEPPANGRVAAAANGNSIPDPTPPTPASPGFGGPGRDRDGNRDGSMVAALQELPRREPREPLGDPVPPTEPVNVPSFDPPPGGPTGFFPDLRAAFDGPSARGDQGSDNSGLDDLPLPIDAPPPPPPPPGLEHLNDVGGIPIEPGSRPSEWGRGVFDTDEEGSPGRFGRR
jgi:DivIVA domain-containing protein